MRLQVLRCRVGVLLVRILRVFTVRDRFVRNLRLHLIASICVAKSVYHDHKKFSTFIFLREKKVLSYYFPSDLYLKSYQPQY